MSFELFFHFGKSFSVGPTGDRGSTLVESMIALTIFAASALAVFPILVTTKTYSRGTDVRELCTQTVKAKLAQYMAGGDLSALTESDYGTLSVAKGASGWRSGAFQYAKMRYNELYRGGICDGQSRAAILNSSSGEMKSLGIRECIGSSVVATTKPFASMCRDLSSGIYTGKCGSSSVSSTPTFSASFLALPGEVTWNDTFGGTNCTSDADKKVQSQLPNFRLYVKLERVSPWKMDSAGLADLQEANDFRYHPSCPNSWSGPFSGKASDQAVYDFDSLGDAIRATVTGVIDLSTFTSNQLNSFAGISKDDPGRLMCSVSSIVTQDEAPIRYALSGADMIALRGKGLSSTDRAQDRTVLATSGIDFQGFHALAVHPLNLSVYLLGADRIDRLSECGGIPLDCHTGGSVQKMLDDDGSNDSVSDPSTQGGVQNYSSSGLGNVYRSILIDQRSGGEPAVYLGSAGLCNLWKADFGAAGVLGLTVSTETTAPRLFSAFGDYLGTEACNGVVVAGVNQTGAVQGAIMDPAGGEGFVLGLGQQGNALYRAKDWQREHAVLRVQPGIRAVAK